jgi:tetratricopeptide (TPR) repeat protein
MVSRTRHASVLHQAGRITETESLFREAEDIQRERDPTAPRLYSIQGFLYCDLLLDQGRWRDVEQRAEQAIVISRRNRWLLDIALDHLSLGRAALIGSSAQDKASLARAADHLNLAVEGLREANVLRHLPRGLLARAELSIATKAFAAARADLDETLSIATRTDMRLHEAEAHLGFTRLHLAESDRPRARESLERARKLVEETSYHRRDKEVEELARKVESE